MRPSMGRFGCRAETSSRRTHLKEAQKCGLKAAGRGKIPFGPVTAGRGVRRGRVEGLEIDLTGASAHSKKHAEKIRQPGIGNESTARKCVLLGYLDVGLVPCCTQTTNVFRFKYLDPRKWVLLGYHPQTDPSLQNWIAPTNFNPS